MAVTFLHVVYGNILKDDAFHWVNGPDGEKYNINEEGGIPVYLATRSFEDAGEDPLIDLKVLRGDEPVPDGYCKSSVNIFFGAGGAKAYLCFKRWKEGADNVLKPIGEIAVVADNTEGYEPTGLTFRNGSKLVFKRVEDGVTIQPTGWKLEELSVGNFVDVFEPRESVWHIAKLIEIGNDVIRIAYRDMGSGYREELPLNSPRVAEEGFYSLEQTNPPQSTAFEWFGALDLTIALLDNYLTSFDTLPLATREFIVYEACQVWRFVMQSAIDTADNQDKVLVYMKKMMDVILFHMQRPAEPYNLYLLRIFERMSLTDDKCDYFLCHYGAYKFDRPAEQVHGNNVSFPDAGASKYYIYTWQHFGAANGFDLMRQPVSWTGHPLADLTAYAGMFRIAKYCSTVPFLTDTITPTLEFYGSKLREYSDEQLRLIDDIATTTLLDWSLNTRNLLRRWKELPTAYPYPMFRGVEEFEVTVCLRYMAAAIPAVIKKGFEMLSNVLSRVGDSTMTAGVPVDKVQFLWLTPAHLFTYLADHDALNIAASAVVAFGESDRSIADSALDVIRFVGRSCSVSAASVLQMLEKATATGTSALMGRVLEALALEAVGSGDISVLQAVIQHPTGFTEVQKAKWLSSAFAVACRNAQVASLDWLVNTKHVDIRRTDKFGNNGLYWIAESGSVPALKWLLSNGFIATQEMLDGALWVAVRCGHVAFTVELVNHLGANITPLKQSVQQGLSLFFGACMRGHVPMAKWIGEFILDKLDYRDKGLSNAMGMLVKDWTKATSPLTLEQCHDLCEAMVLTGCCWNLVKPGYSLIDIAQDLRGEVLASLVDVVDSESVYWSQRRCWLNSILRYCRVHGRGKVHDTSGDAEQSVAELLTDYRLVRNMENCVTSHLAGQVSSFLPGCCPCEDCPIGVPILSQPKQ